MKKILLTPAAQKDLDEIWDYSEQRWGTYKAREYVELLQKALIDIGCGVRIVRPAHIRAEYFKYEVGSHMIFMQISDHAVNVIRVLHSRMDPERHM